MFWCFSEFLRLVLYFISFVVRRVFMSVELHAQCICDDSKIVSSCEQFDGLAYLAQPNYVCRHFVSNHAVVVDLGMSAISWNVIFRA